MARLNVYVPTALADAARSAGLNVSALTQAAITHALESHATDTWLASIPGPERRISHRAALEALDEARDELGTRG